MLARLLEEKINEEGMSIRRASREIGVAHTTVGRIIEGEDPSYDTLRKIAGWLGVSPELLASFDRDGKEAYAAKLVGILARSPRLTDKLGEAIQKYESGEFSEEDIEDIINYIAYRLS